MIAFIGRAQFVAHVGQKLALGPVGRLRLVGERLEIPLPLAEFFLRRSQAFAHMIERARQFAQLVLAEDRDAIVEMPRAQRIRAGLQYRETAPQPAGDKKRQHPRQQPAENEDRQW